MKEMIFTKEAWEGIQSTGINYSHRAIDFGSWRGNPIEYETHGMRHLQVGDGFCVYGAQFWNSEGDLLAVVPPAFKLNSVAEVKVDDQPNGSRILIYSIDVFLLNPYKGFGMLELDGEWIGVDRFHHSHPNGTWVFQYKFRIQ